MHTPSSSSVGYCHRQYGHQLILSTHGPTSHHHNRRCIWWYTPCRQPRHSSPASVCRWGTISTCLNLIDAPTNFTWKWSNVHGSNGTTYSNIPHRTWWLCIRMMLHATRIDLVVQAIVWGTMLVFLLSFHLDHKEHNTTKPPKQTVTHHTG